ncbi:protein N-terminal asparagine amidohydrolase-like isoform X2 [Pomacea canaliculata]|uniref:protein N-terminal asparagine amidohydrolase-like isoform X2 n=1 Tax=Pomacea canaliculata TaxID=400727 RepID=UPI000D731512|nr:protein N-terminal asparagine amidohydrolase-like isoform X2 [Pomacea canaliculata]
MPLWINEKSTDHVSGSLAEFFQIFPVLKISASYLTSQKPNEFGPKDLLYIGQREYGGTCPDDDVIKIIGSEGATTCHIGILRHTGSGAVCMLHFDGYSMNQGVESMVQLILELSQHKLEGRLEFHVVGGFMDDNHISEKISMALFRHLSQCKEDIYLVTACIGDVNTTYKNGVPFPVIYGVAVDVQTGAIYNASFPDHGPDEPLRSTRVFSGNSDPMDQGVIATFKASERQFLWL